MNRDDDNELWDLLGKSRPQPLSPFFARNVVREIRQTPTWRDIASRWLSPSRAIPAMAVAVAICATVWIAIPQDQPASVSSADEDVPEVVARLDVEDYEIVADLDDLLASQEDDSWDDTLTL